MDWLLACLRLLVRMAWILPVFWALQLGSAGWLGPVLPAHFLIIFGLLEIALWTALAPSLKLAERLLARIGFGVAVAGAAFGVVPLVALATGRSLSISTLVLDVVLLIGVSLLSLTVLTDASYQTVLGDLRLGIIAVIFALAFLTVVVGQHRVHLSPPVYFGVAGYVLIGVFTLSIARRFAFDEETEDDRKSDLEPDWVLTTLILVSGLAVIAVILAQVFAFDVVGLVGRALFPVQRILIGGLQDLLLAIVNLIGRVGSLLHVHIHVKPRRVRPYKPLTGPHHKPNHNVSHNHAPKWLATVFKVIGILILGGVVMGILLAIARAFGGFRMSTLRGERRISRWSWRKMLRWTFGRAADELWGLMPSISSPLHGPRSMRTVRDIYREFLRMGKLRARARAPDETGLEYSRDIQDRWHGAGRPLEELNVLYMRERYGSQQSSEEAITTAKRDLESIREASEVR